MKNRVFIVIVTYNGMQWIDTCLNSIPSIYEIVIVDNNSSDDTVSFIREQFPRAKMIQQQKNLGFGGANNVGMRYALKQGADYVFLLNQDAYLQPTTIERLIEVHKENNDFAILSPIHLNGNGDKLDFNFSNYAISNKDFLFDAVKNKYSKKIYEVPFVNAAAWLVPKATLETIGGFDPLFFHYGEDINYCHRILFHQLKIGIIPNTFVQHDRELRPANENFTDKSKMLERRFKNKYANVNSNFELDIPKTIYNIRKKILKSILTFKFSKVGSYKKELEFTNKYFLKIKKSRNINSEKGNQYL